MTHLTLGTANGQSTWTPNTDVYEAADKLIVKMELAGVEKDELEVTLHSRLLVVCGYREDTCRQRQHQCVFRQMEVDYGFFERRIVLPYPVEVKRARAQLRNGFLRVELPKATRLESRAVALVIELRN